MEGFLSSSALEVHQTKKFWNNFTKCTIVNIVKHHTVSKIFMSFGIFWKEKKTLLNNLQTDAVKIHGTGGL